MPADKTVDQVRDDIWTLANQMDAAWHPLRTAIGDLLHEVERLPDDDQHERLRYFAGNVRKKVNG